MDLLNNAKTQEATLLFSESCCNFCVDWETSFVAAGVPHRNVTFFVRIVVNPSFISFKYELGKYLFFVTI